MRFAFFMPFFGRTVKNKINLNSIKSQNLCHLLRLISYLSIAKNQK